MRGNRNISLGSFGPIFDFVVVVVLSCLTSSSFQQSGLSSGLDYLSFLASNLIDALQQGCIVESQLFNDQGVRGVLYVSKKH